MRAVKSDVRRWLGAGAFAAGIAVSAGCGKTGAAGAPSGSASAGLQRGANGVDAKMHERAGAMVVAERRRASAEVQTSDLGYWHSDVRRGAARALARIADARAAELLVTSLSDDASDVIGWSAYGLGEACAGHEREHSRALAARAASLLVKEPPANPATAMLGNVLPEPLPIIAGALGRCGGDDAERTLRAWVASSGSLAEPAGLALGTVASRADRLEDATLVALLAAAGRADRPVATAFQAFTRLSHLDEAVRSRLYTVARSALHGSGLARLLAVRALPAAGPQAAPDLGAVLRSREFSSAERADAARGLGRLGDAGQAALGDALEPLVSQVLDGAEFTFPSFGVLGTALGLLKSPDRGGPALSRLAALPVRETPVERRRTVALRCAAASILAGRGTESGVLATCDPDPNGRAGRLALLRVLERGPLRGQRQRLFRALAAADDAVVRERALELVPAHPELEGAGALVAAELERATPGDVATAARLIADHPDRVASSREVPDPDPAVTKALTRALGTFARSTNIEVRASLADASGALALLSAKPGLEADCKSDNPTLREHAAKALRLLGNREQRCDTFTPAPPEPLEASLRERTTLVFETDVGAAQLELLPDLAGVAAQRILALAKAGFYDGMVIHRVVPGFVVQLGDPGGDGYGGVDQPPLRCETAPVAFQEGDVGIALSGRDTGSSQFFVTLAREPHLDGAYARIGHGARGWERLAEGDIVKKVTVKNMDIR
jgi:cyclophilin family peptidyl-prolyl cis-trans isomerase